MILGVYNMNLFLLDENPKHSAKMILEGTQILNTALHKNNLSTLAFYKKTHENHPCCEWASESRWNFMFLLQHTYALGEEYISRFSKDERHASHRKLARTFDGYTKDMIRRELPSEPFYRNEKVPQDWCDSSNEEPDWIKPKGLYE